MLVVLILLAVGAIQLPFVVDVFEATHPSGRRWGRAIRQWLGIFYFAVILCLAAVALGYFFTLFLPLWLGADPGWLPWAAHVALALFLWANTTGNFICAAMGSPGYVPSVGDETATAAAAGRQCHGTRRHGQPTEPRADEARSTSGGARGGEAVGEPRTDPGGPSSSTHHCSVCGRSVAQMDHHCPFTMNCVGRDNFSDFYLFLLFGVAGSAYAAVLCAGPFFRCWLRLLLDPVLDPQCGASDMDALLFLPVATVLLAAGSLLGIHTALLLLDKTTIGFLRDMNTDPGWSLAGELRAAAACEGVTGPGSKLTDLLVRPRGPWVFWLVPYLYKRRRTKNR